MKLNLKRAVLMSSQIFFFLKRAFLEKENQEKEVPLSTIHVIVSPRLWCVCQAFFSSQPKKEKYIYVFVVFPSKEQKLAKKPPSTKQQTILKENRKINALAIHSYTFLKRLSLSKETTGFWSFQNGRRGGGRGGEEEGEEEELQFLPFPRAFNDKGREEGKEELLELPRETQWDNEDA